MRGQAYGGPVALLAVSTLLSAGQARERDEAWVLERARQVRESDTNGWRKIPWTPSLLEARRVSREEGRPVFLFTHDGNIETGRC
jgi:hypothetical protein